MVTPRLVGDVQAPLLRVVKIKGEHGQMVNEIFETIQYFPLNQSNVDCIHVEIKDDVGFVIPFEQGKYILPYILEPHTHVL